MFNNIQSCYIILFLGLFAFFMYKTGQNSQKEKNLNKPSKVNYIIPQYPDVPFQYPDISYENPFTYYWGLPPTSAMNPTLNPGSIGYHNSSQGGALIVGDY